MERGAEEEEEEGEVESRGGAGPGPGERKEEEEEGRGGSKNEEEEEEEEEGEKSGTCPGVTSREDVEREDKYCGWSRWKRILKPDSVANRRTQETVQAAFP